MSVNDKLKHIGHLLNHSDELGGDERQRQAEAYRTSVESFR
jgi:hypothetical protein